MSATGHNRKGSGRTILFFSCPSSGREEVVAPLLIRAIRRHSPTIYSTPRRRGRAASAVQSDRVPSAGLAALLLVIDRNLLMSESGPASSLPGLSQLTPLRVGLL